VAGKNMCYIYWNSNTHTSSSLFKIYQRERSYTGIGKFYSYPYNGYQDVSVGDDSSSG
jgi:hypothetical protein